jgi:hypothetical protein
MDRVDPSWSRVANPKRNARDAALIVSSNGAADRRTDGNAPSRTD